jgi:hypothetical protein
MLDKLKEILKRHIMKKSILVAGILVLANFCFGQVKNGYYSGNLVEEYVWSRTNEEYKLLESIPMKTEIMFSPEYIYFKKGANAKWLHNKWVFDQTVEYENGTKYDRYYDESNQMILIDYVSSEILYYYNWDINSNSFSNIAIYKNLIESTNSNSSSEQEEIAKFIITDASVNGIDNTPTILDQGAYTVFYTFQNDGLIYMANYWPKNDSQSYGPMYSAATNSLNETYETYKADIFYYNWRYTNDYDGKSGTAKVQLTKIYKPQGVAFILKIIPENLDVIVYKGYMEGTVDFSQY